MMTSRRRFHRSIWTGLTVLVLAGCLSNPPKPSNVKLTVRATADVNPDANGRPSPVVVRIYQLKADAAFAGAEFFALFDDEKKALGPDLIKSDEFTVGPGESSPAPVAVSPDARFIGVIAAYRDYRNAQWRVVTKAPLRNNTTVSVGRLKLELVSK